MVEGADVVVVVVKSGLSVVAEVLAADVVVGLVVSVDDEVCCVVLEVVISGFTVDVVVLAVGVVEVC